MSLELRKVAALIPVTVEQLVDAGLMEDTRPPVQYPWRVRARAALAWRVSRARRRVGAWIAGVDPEEW